MVEVSRPKICIVNTPGEINDLGSRFASPLEVSPEIRKIADIDVLDLTDRRSGLAGLSHEIAEKVYGRREAYQGFVVTGFKDALQFIAPRLAFAFGPGIDKTIAVTGTDIPAAEVTSAARPDLAKAVMVAATDFSEVVIAYDNMILRGTSFVAKNVGYSGRLVYEPSSLKGELGEITARGVEVKPYNLANSIKGDTFKNDFQLDIPVFGLSPATEPEFFQPVPGLEGVAFDSPSWRFSSREPFSMAGVLLRYATNGIPVLITSHASDSMVHTQDFLRRDSVINLGAITSRGMSQEVALAKFSWAIGTTKRLIEAGELAEGGKISHVAQLMQRAYVGEFGHYRPFTE